MNQEEVAAERADELLAQVRAQIQLPKRCQRRVAAGEVVHKLCTTCGHVLSMHPGHGHPDSACQHCTLDALYAVMAPLLVLMGGDQADGA